VLALLTYTLALVAAAVRIFNPADYNGQVLARCLYAIVIVMLGTKLLESVRVSETVGVLAIIFTNMVVKDCIPFIWLALILAPPMGCALSVLQPRTILGEARTDFVGGISDVPELTIFRYLDSPFWAPWWAILGDFDIGTLFESGQGIVFVEWLLPLLYFAYLSLMLIVLLNLLIAAMSATFEELEANSAQESKYARAQIVLEYKDEKMWPAPLNVGHIACRLIAFLFRCCMGTAGSDRSSVGGFRTEMSVADELDSQSREQSALRTCYAKHVAAKHKETAVAKLHEFVAQGNESTHVRLESMQRQIKRLMEVVEGAQPSGASLKGMGRRQRVDAEGDGGSPVPNW